MTRSHQNQYIVGKVRDFAKRKGWFFGHFMDEELLKSHLVEVAWQNISSKKPDPIDEHFHKRSVEVNIVISGWVKITLSGKRFKVKKGDFYIIYPQTVIEDVEAGEKTELIIISAPSIPGDKYLTE